MDWASWWVSRWLGASLLDTIDRAAGRGSKIVSLVGYMVIDLVVAVILLWLLAMALPFVIQLFNLWCREAGLTEPLPLAAFLDQVVQRPWPKGIWVLTMLLSTLVPTALHAMVLIASPFMVWLRSDATRVRIAAGLSAKEPEHWAYYDASRHLIQALLIGIAASLALAWAFVSAADVLWSAIGDRPQRTVALEARAIPW